MSVILKLALQWAWALLLPYLGPLLVRLARWWAPWSGIRIGLGAIAALVLALCAFGGAWWLLSRDPPPSPAMVSAAQVEAQRWKALAEARATAAREKDAALVRRAASIAELEAEINSLNVEMEALRAQTADPHRVVLPADDPWLRARRARR
jgi:hypothetical protein